MELDELENMISIIGEKKTKCRGNLRLKVLLKLTHDHVRRSWIDGQLGNPEKLITLLRNTHIHRDVDDHEESMDVDEPPKNDVSLTVQSSKTCPSSEISVTSTENADKFYSCELAQNEKIEAFKNKNNYDSKKQVLFKKDLKLQKTVERLLKECGGVETERDSKNSQLHHHKVKKIGKLLTQCKIYLKTDNENQNVDQKLRIGKLLKTIKKLLKEYEDVVSMNVCDTELNVLCLKSHYKLKKLSKKLKKYKNNGYR